MSLIFALRGKQGDPGEPGEDGEDGDPGDKGDKGDKGDTGEAGACNLVDRGDPDSDDFSLTDFTTNGNWANLNLSGIVPIGSEFVLISFLMKTATVGSEIRLRKKGNTYGYNIQRRRITVSNQTIGCTFLIPLSDDRKIEYLFSNVTWSVIGCVVNAWVV